jgi:hypothetical protein
MSRALFLTLEDKLLSMTLNLQHPKNRIKLHAHYKPILPNLHRQLFLRGENGVGLIYISKI